MHTIGDLIDTLLGSDIECIWLRMVCDNTTDEGELAEFRLAPINEDMMAIFCNTIAAQIRFYLNGVSSEENYNSILKEGHEFFEAVWGLVKDFGIPQNSVCIPISFCEMVAQVGFIKIEDGMVSLTEEGRAATENFMKSE